MPLWHNKDKSDNPLRRNGLNGLSLFFFHQKMPQKRGLRRGVKSRTTLKGQIVLDSKGCNNEFLGITGRQSDYELGPAKEHRN